ncbi:class II aldolase/adducin family protein [Micromonospora sp. 4G57]|uniref:Class II aldolase/adducin family protein n=1 Tax=Micromonospora sicca TaxID=2202420 RepID=A0ABU5JE43_9ACTN|nr:MULTISPECIES: class II aldolase/adducin family protein [unclassified Micromonospora]MDZ5445024.1 class II aldolase/adducin family protein [Micromonospora sp. 4G57]MDZ5490856.1 class II aldolase/adducin family protein [Micromonospora sp. 4G53]
MTIPAELADPRRTVALACRILANSGLVEDILGHVSVRVGHDRMLVRCRGPQEEGLLFTLDRDVHLVDLDGSGDLPAGWVVPNELPIHGELLRARPEIDAVVHCHPPAVLLAGVEKVPLRPVFGAYHIPAARLAVDGIPVYPRAGLVRRPELGRELVETMGSSTVCLMRGHGITTVGSGAHAVEQAVVRALAVDVLARVSVERARLGDRAADLTAEDLAELPDLGSSFNDLNMWRHHIARLRLAGLALE